MKLITKAVVGGAALTLAVLGAGGFTVVSAQHSSAQVTSFENKDSQLQHTVAAMLTDFYAYDDQNNMYVLVAVGAPTQVALWHTTHDQAVQAAASLQTDIDKTRKLTSDPKILALLDRVETDKKGYDVFFTNGYNYILAGQGGKAALEETVGNLVPSNDIMPALTELQTRANTIAVASLAKVKSGQRSVQLAAIASMVIAVLLTLALIIGFLRVALSPMRKISARMHEIAEGEADLTQRLDAGRNDELGDLSDGFDKFVSGIQDLVVQFAGTAGSLSGSAEQLSATSQALSQGAIRAADLATSAASSAIAVQDGVLLVTTGTEQMTASIAEIASSASEGARVAQDSLEIAQETVRQITMLGEASQEISSVVALITNIASQTNLLALNATIEAARAGDAGKGFAVVASEVKDLAQETSRATEDITRRINDLQQTSQSAGVAISRISDVIHELNGYSVSIAAAVEQQSVATADMSQAINGASANSMAVSQSFGAVAEAAGATSAGAEASQRAAEELVGIAGQLDSAIARFRYR